MNERTPDTAITEAMNRVLAAEREASDAIASAQRAAESLIESARERRRRILESARRRATTLHVRAQARLRAALDELEHGHGSPGSAADDMRALAREAIDGLARRLTSVDHEPH
jgi:hypothetical protein